jgi:LmbE family N-acetylglucosaminyl deacetylase
VSGALVVSPHLDDAVLGCGAWIAAHPGTRVLTVFAGAPPPGALAADPTEWDAACGFESAAHAIAARRAEDRAALALLDAEPEWLGWCDDQYRVPAPAGALTADLRRALARHDPEAVLVPLGLFHRDHRSAHEAALPLVAEQRGRAWYAYEDALYRAIPGLVQRRLAGLEQHGVTATPERPRPATGRKRRALACYASQLRGLATPGRPGSADALATERLWRLTA